MSTVKPAQLGTVRNAPDHLEVDRRANVLIVYDEMLERPVRGLVLRLSALLRRSLNFWMD